MKVINFKRKVIFYIFGYPNFEPLPILLSGRFFLNFGQLMTIDYYYYDYYLKKHLILAFDYFLIYPFWLLSIYI
jgi:hypothetical protein